MCLGIPMQVLKCESERALCTDGSEQQWVDMSLLDTQPEGSWVLVFLGAARDVLTPERAVQIQNALGAVSAVMQGEQANFDALFADLVEREPELPAHLRTAIKN